MGVSAEVGGGQLREAGWAGEVKLGPGDIPEVLAGLEKGEEAGIRATVVGTGGSGRKMWMRGSLVMGRQRGYPRLPPAHLIGVRPVAQGLRLSRVLTEGAWTASS